jgi:hypothetical protein
MNLYIPYGYHNEKLYQMLKNLLESIKLQSLGVNPVVLNNSKENLRDYLREDNYFPDIIYLDLRLVQCQMFNWALEISKQKKDPFCLITHTDTVLKPYAIKKMKEKIESLKYNHWALCEGGYGSMVFFAINNEFVDIEDFYFDPNLFPMYFDDNHARMIMKSRGWEIHYTDDQNLAEHLASQTINTDKEFHRKNDLTFPLFEQLYIKIWGGKPDQETIQDSTANGTYLRDK